MTIEQDEGERPELSPDVAMWTEALGILRAHLVGRNDFVADRVADVAGRFAGLDKWELIGKRITRPREATAMDGPDAN